MTTINELKQLAKTQGVKVTTEEAKKWREIISIVEANRLISPRIQALNKAGYYQKDAPMKTGFGVGTCIKRMTNGNLRIRVSASWGVRFSNYAVCVEI